MGHPKSIRIGLIGAGTVGREVAAALHAERESLERGAGHEIRLSRVATRTLRDTDVTLAPDAMWSTDTDALVAADDVDIVVELIGGCDDALRLVRDAIERGKPVVTANKALLAEHGRKLFELSRSQSTPIYFEAAVAAAIPIIGALKSSLRSEMVTHVSGILNGTGNYILTAMTREGATFEEALRRAQELGYAEADPTLDVGGGDAAHKTWLLAAMAFGVALPPVEHRGISEIDALDVELARRFGCVIKALGVAERTAMGVAAHVTSALVDADHGLGAVYDNLNAVLVRGPRIAEVQMSGPGAGGAATAASVLSDIQQACQSHGRAIACDFLHLKPQDEALRLESEHHVFLRATVEDRPGVLSELASDLAMHGVSIARMLQTPDAVIADAVTVALVTHPVSFPVVQQAAAAFSERSSSRLAPMLLPIFSTTWTP